MPKDSTLLATAKRRREVIELRESGATWSDIADAMETRHGTDALPNHWGKRYACQDFHRALGKVQDEVKDRARTVREMELKRLNRLQKGLWEEAKSGDTDAVRTIVRLMKRRAKYLGLDEPDELDVSGGFDYELVETLLDALEDYPEARQAVAAALDEE
jgi:hypothetical protein